MIKVICDKCKKELVIKDNPTKYEQISKYEATLKLDGGFINGGAKLHLCEECQQIFEEEVKNIVKSFLHRESEEECETL